MSYVITKNKVSGIFFLVLGLISLIFLSVLPENKLIISKSDFFLIKYFVVILFGNGGILGILFGVLILIGVLSPHSPNNLKKYEQAKIKVFAVVATAPTLFAIFFIMFVGSRTTIWRVLSVLFLLYIIWELISSINMIKKEKEKVI
jgi:hypothetical protein